MHRFLCLAFLLSFASCAPAQQSSMQHGDVQQGDAQHVIARSGSLQHSVELVESVPLETLLDHPSIPDTREVWLEMLRASRRSIDIAQFYIADAPGQGLEAVIAEVVSAASRGVRVRVLAEKKFSGTYPETLERWRAVPGMQVRIFDLAGRTGGVLHAKYFIVDDETVFVGSQNWDWRALAHINELGLRVRDSEIAAAFTQVFAYDWDLAADTDPADADPADADPAVADPADIDRGAAFSDTFPRRIEDERGSHELTPVFSPRALLPEGARWDSDALTVLIDGARDSVKLQLLSYGTYAPLENALLRAASRGVRVSLLVSDWSLSSSKQKDLKRLQTAEGMTVKFTAIPEHSSGFISFARVEHCKYLLADDTRAWIGTSNWSPDYFLESRNTGIILRSKPLCVLLHEKYAMSWNGPYATTIDPSITYKSRKRDGGDGK